MIKHIVMWKLKETAEGNSKEENALQMKALLENLKNTIDLIKELEVKLNDDAYNSANYDIILNMSCKNYEDLDSYQTHPDHQKVVSFVKKVVELRSAIDYATD